MLSMCPEDSHDFLDRFSFTELCIKDPSLSSTVSTSQHGYFIDSAGVFHKFVITSNSEGLKVFGSSFLLTKDLSSKLSSSSSILSLLHVSSHLALLFPAQEVTYGRTYLGSNG